MEHATEREPAPLIWLRVINQRSPHYDRIGWVSKTESGKVTLVFDGAMVEFEGWELEPFYVS